MLPVLAAVLLKPDAPAPPIVQTLVRVFAPWQTLFSDSKVISTAVVAIHVVALLFGGGLAVAADRVTLRTLRTLRAVRAGAPGGIADERRLLADLGAVHRPVLIALTFLFASGVLLAASDVKTYALLWLFWLKLSLVALLLINGIVLERAEAGLRRMRTTPTGAPDATAAGRWRRLRTATWASLALWTATTVVGVALTSAS